jgi:hypothetical protein
VRKARLLHGTPTEVLLVHGHDGVVDTYVPIHVDGVDVDDGGLVDDDVVDDARAAPASP